MKRVFKVLRELRQGLQTTSSSVLEHGNERSAAGHSLRASGCETNHAALLLQHLRSVAPERLATLQCYLRKG
jgi:hypothetical protein